MRRLVGAVLKLYFRVRVVNPPPPGGGYVVVANHASYLDPIVLGAVNPERVAFLINQASARSSLLGWFYRLFRAIPVDLRGSNLATVRTCHAALDAGEVIGVFPEGGITRDGGLLLGNPGAVALVLRKNVAIVPAGLVGVADALPYGSPLPRPRRIEVRYGDPIPPSELEFRGNRKERIRCATERIMREIAKLCDLTAREDELVAQRQEQRSREAQKT